MKIQWKKLFATGIAILMVCTAARIQVLAEAADEIVEEIGVEEDASLNYVYFDNEVIEQGNQQSIVVNISNVQTLLPELQTVSLGYQINGAEAVISYTEMIDDMILFQEAFQEIGSYQLQYIELQMASGVKHIDFADYGVQASFEVIEATDDICEPVLVDEIPVCVSGGNVVELLDDVLPQNVGGGDVVVVLDPGHDNLHCGATGYGLREENINLKIAQYCKAELEQYNNVTVYMTREDGNCPDTSSNANCMKTRCNFAASVNADVLVSIHIDSGSNSASGSLAIVAKNGVYRDDLSVPTQEIGQKILDELSAIGLASRGLYIRMSDSAGEEFRYPNGAVADWYSITRNSIKAGVPGIIIEHGFISNPSDVANYLNSDSKLQKLGIADATGIAEYFKLSKNSITEAMKDSSTEPYESNGETVADFVARLYNTVLERQPSKAEVSWWVAKVETDQLTGIALTNHFIKSQEFQNRQYSDAEYVEKLYEVFLERKSEEEGKAYWMSRLASGASRTRIAEQFGSSPEFEMVCARYGVAQGSHSMQYVKLYPEIAEFVTEYYNGLLHRQPDAAGLEYWTKTIICRENTVSDLSRKFINSPEFQNQNLNSSEFVESLYQTYLGRASEPEGKKYWMSKLPTMSNAEKEAVIRGFIHSEEYENYCGQYGLNVGKF